MNINILDKEDEEGTRLFWKTKSAEERLSAVEFLREQLYLVNGLDEVPTIVLHIQVLKR
jgi:hypothetical protein